MVTPKIRYWLHVLGMRGCLLPCYIGLVVSHIRSADNRVADLLSRWHLTPDNVKKLSQLVQSPIWIDTHIDLTLNHDI